MPKRSCPSSSITRPSIRTCSSAASRGAISVKSLILVDQDEFEAVPGSQLVATRTTFKDNMSKAPTLTRYRLGPQSFPYSAVGSIALINPKGGENEDGLLSYLEDIVGTASLKQPIDQALAVVEEVREMRAEKLNRLRLLSGVAAQTALREEERHKENIEEVEANYKIRQNYARKHAKSKVKKLHKTITDDEATLGVRSRAVLDKRPKTQVFRDQITVKQQELAPWKAGIDGKRSEIEVATSQRDGLARRLRALLRLTSKRRRTCRNSSRINKSRLSERNAIAPRVGIGGCWGACCSTQLNLAQRRASAGSTRQTVTQARASQAEGKKPNAALQASTNLASEGKGCLGSLGKIADDKDDVAVTAASCIEHLRRTKVRATAQQIANEPQPGDVPRLFDLKDPKFACADDRGQWCCGSQAASEGMSSKFTADAVAPKCTLQAAQLENMDAETVGINWSHLGHR
ncbi:hypothetical protein BDZ89DRAFT_1051497 [Hymenopellis radicata]|nr:hypothetical protein BDZ89DRAFT_1051497 [Hymenopellis radicata]